MTLIASFTINGYPIIIGDLLISSQAGAIKPCRIPTVGEITNIFPDISTFVPVGLSQKVIIVDDDFVLAWAGNKLQATVAVNIIFERNTHCKLDAKSILELLREFEEDQDFNELSLICMVKEGDKISRSSLRARHLQTNNFGELIVSGTGADCDSIFWYLNQLEQNIIEEDPIGSAVGSILTYFASLMSVEMFKPSKNFVHNLYHYYGGGYEIATYINSRITKIDEIAYWYFIAEPEDQHVNLKLAPSKAFKYSYKNNILHIFAITTSCAMGLNGNNPNIILEKDIHVITSLVTKNLPSLSVEDLNISAKWNIISIILNKRDGSMQLIRNLYYRPMGNSPICINDDIIQFEKSTFDDLMQYLQQEA